MLKKLRAKFVTIIMAMVSLVLVAAFSVICAINYQQSVDVVHDSLNAAINRHTQHLEGMRNNFAAPSFFEDESLPPESDSSSGSFGEQYPEDTQVRPFEIGGAEQERELIPVAVYLVDADGTITSLSDTATAIIAEDLLDDAAADARASNDEFGFLDSVGLYFAKRSTGDSSYLAFADKDSANSWQSLAMNLALVGVAALVVFAIASIIFSKWATRPVERSWTQQQRFITDASHDLKTPLTVMLASTSILLDHPEKSIASQRQWVDSIESEAETMKELVSDLLFLAEPAETTASSKKETVDLSTLVERNLLQFEPLAFEKNIKVVSDIARTVPIRGNITHLDRLISVLFDNAFKYAGSKGCVTVSFAQVGQHIKLTVANTGAAIPAQDLPHVFDRFYRVDKVRERSVEGYGLGLSIAQEIVREHHGTIDVASSDKTGTVFTVTLPASYL